ncbi:acetoacetate--CoA ligase [bacterium]|nr:acetoacetate--CoA ligase [bacterium]
MRKLLWKPSQSYAQNSNMKAFLDRVNAKYGLFIYDYRSLYEWSIMRPCDFWGTLWEYLDIICSKPYTEVADDIYRFPGCHWFTGAQLNYAENILRFADSERPALIFYGENQVRRELSFREMRQQVWQLAQKLRSIGIKPGDAVAAYLPNMPETIIAMLAAAAVGALWCSCATDIGAGAAIDRLGQTQPKVLFTADGYYYKGKTFRLQNNIQAIIEGIPSLQQAVVVHYAGEPIVCEAIPCSSWDEFLGSETVGDFAYEQLPAEQPLVVMFSSGTTGKPKCLVQSAAGLLVNQLKELVLHHDIKADDRMLYITSCSWMMWNWQLAALGAGCSLVLYDGNPSYPDTAAIWRVLEKEKVSVFGLSASYIHALLAAKFSPKNEVDLTHLRQISQTGSALSEDGFDYIYQEIKSDLHFNSIAGGTDINGCFSIGNPLSPVYSNELQSPGLGCKINCYDDKGRPQRDEQGELVCEIPIPSMPLYFVNDPDGKRYHSAYFEVYPNIWHHGDFVVIHSDTYGISYYGRSDSILKPSGVRIGTAEIYNQVEKLPEIADSLAIGQNYKGDQRIILFVQLAQGAELNDDLRRSIKSILRTNASPRHVPAVILAAPDIPKTLNGKKVESAVTNIINGRPVTNRDALQNPQSLDFYVAAAKELQ